MDRASPQRNELPSEIARECSLIRGICFPTSMRATKTLWSAGVEHNVPKLPCRVGRPANELAIEHDTSADAVGHRHIDKVVAVVASLPEPHLSERARHRRILDENGNADSF